MLKSGLIGLLGLACVAGCSSTTSHATGGDAQGGRNTTADAGAATAGGSDGSGAMHAAGGDGTSGGTDTSGGGGHVVSGDPSTPAGFCAGYYAVVADLLAKCWGLSADEVASLLADPMLCSTFVASVDQQRIGFDGSRGAACLSELKSAVGCEGNTELASVPDCTLLTPRVAVGGACSNASDVALGRECAGDAFCQTPNSYACGGVCAERAPVGAACDSRTTTTIRCATGATCDSATQKCVPTPAPAAVGEPCGGTADGKCQTGLWCDRGAGAATSTGVCSTRKASGACSFSNECQSAKVCAGATDAKSCADPKPLGAACTPGNRECSLASYCSSDQKCSNVAASLGEACGILQGEPVPCARGGYCEGGLVGPGVCQTPKAAGAACTGTSLGECGGERGHCDTTTHTCAACSP